MIKLLCTVATAAVVVSAASSSGCGTKAPFDTGDLTEQWMESDKKNRTYLVNLPDAYDKNVAAPLILSFHGNGRTAEDQSKIDDFVNGTWNPDTIVVYPQGVNNGWEVAPYVSGNVDDILFTSDLLANLSSTFCIDDSRIYCSGKSIGGGFCNMLACDNTLSASFAAIAPVSGAYYSTPANETFSSNCDPAHLMPVLEFHGTNDNTIPYDGDSHNGVNLPSIADWAKEWAEADGCSSSDSVTTAHYNDSKVLWATYSCNGSTNVVQHYAIDGLDHIWPSTESNFDNGGDPTYIDASPIILSFFKNYTLEDATAGASSSSSASSTKSGASSTGTAKASSTASGSSASSSGAAAMVTMFPGLVGAIAIGAIVL